MSESDGLRQAREQSLKWAEIAGERAPVMLVITDPDYRVLWANLDAGRTNVPPEDMPGRLCYELFADRDDVCPGCIVARGHETGEEAEAELEKVRLDGSREFYAVRAIPLKDGSGQIVAWLEMTASLAMKRIAALEAAREQDALAGREAEYLFAHVAATVPVGIGIAVNGRTAWVNPAFAAMFGYTPEEMVGLDPGARMVPEQREAVGRRFARLLNERTTTSWSDVEVIRKDGTRRSIAACSAYCVFHGQDAVLSVTTDVTEERRAQAEVERRNQELAAFYNIARALGRSLELPDVLDVAVQQMLALTGADAAAISLVDRERNILNLVAHRGVPPALVARLDGLSLEASWSAEVVSTGEAFVLGDVTHTPQTMPETVAGGFRSFVAVPLKSQDRVVGVLDLASRRTDHFARAPLDFLVSIGTQIGMAVANAQLFKARADSEEHYRVLFETVADPLLLVAAEDERLLAWNPSFRARFGYGDEELSRMTIRDLIAPEDYPLVAQRRRDRLAGKRVVDHYAVRYLRKDGEVRNVALSVAPHVVQGKTVGILVAARDVTEEKLLQQELVRTEKLSALGQLVSGVAHELNNPLATILLAAEMLLDQETDPEKQVRLEAIIEQVQRSSSLTEDLRLFARRDEPRQQLVDLLQVLQHVQGLVAPAFRRESMKIEVEAPAQVPPVLGDAHQLEQVFLNLMNNARQAMAALPRSGDAAPALCLTISLDVIEVETLEEEAGQAVTVTFRDTGPGVAPEARARLFDPFYTTKPPGQGTGLGLSVSLSIAAAHGGSIALEETEAGASFVVTLPVAPTESAWATGAPRQESADPPAASRLEGLEILVVDDEPHIVTFLADMLNQARCRIDKAYSGSEALERSRANSYDIILCDVKMPQLDGTDYFSALNDIRPDLTARVIFMSGDTSTTATYRALGNLSNVVLEKPFTYAQLAQAIAETRDKG